MTNPAAPYTDDLREFYFSNQSDKVALDTLEFRHPAFVDADNNPIAVRVINESDPYAGFTGTLEADAPMNPGAVVDFTPARFELALPESNSPGLPSCSIAVDNVGSVLMGPIDAAAGIPAPIEVIYRQYLADDPSAPGVVIDGLTIRTINAAALRVTATAGFEDDLNTPFPRKNYTREEYPGLVR